MFITAKRHEREKQELLGASNRLTEAILRTANRVCFCSTAKTRSSPRCRGRSRTLFRRQDFSDLSFERLLATARHGQDTDGGARPYRRRTVRVRAAPGPGGIESAQGRRCAPGQSRRLVRRRALLVRVRPDRHYRVSRACGWCASPISRCGCRRLANWKTCGRRRKRRARSCAASCKWAERASPPFCREPTPR